MSALRAHLKFHSPAIGVWSMMVLLYFGTIILGIDRFPNGDFSGQFHAFARFQAQELLAGRLPLWSDGSFGGFPFIADPQTAVFYPLRWFSILLSAPWGFTFYVLEIEAIFHLWLAGLFTYAFAYSLFQRRIASLVSILVIGLGGYLTSYPLLQLAILETVTWLPLVLLLLRLGIVGGGEVKLRPLLLAAIMLAVSFMAGHPQTFMQMGYVVLAYALWLMWRARWSVKSMFKVGGLLGTTVLGLSAAAFLPAVTYTLNSTRAEVDYTFVSGGLPLNHFLHLVLPGTLSQWSPIYVGIGTLLLLAAAWHGRSRLHGTDALFWSVTAGITAVLSLGDTGYLFALLVRLLPGFSLFRSQERWIGFFAFALALLTGYGVTVWHQMTPAEQKQVASVGWNWVGAGLFIGIVSLTAAPMMAVRPWLPIALRQLILLLLIGILLFKIRHVRGQITLLLLLIVADLTFGTYDGFARVRETPKAYWPEEPWLETLRSEPESGRVDSRLIFWSNFGEIYNVSDIRGISPLKLDVLAQLEQLPISLRWRLLNVTHVLDRKPEPGVPMTAVANITRSIVPGEEQTAFVYRLDEPLAYARLSGKPVQVADETAAYNALFLPDFDPARQVIVHETVPGLEAVTAVPNGSVDVTERRAGFAEMTVTAAETAVLVLSEWHYPGWRVTIDGQPADSFAANYAFQGVIVPPGMHTVTWRYQPLEVTIGILTSLVTVTAVVVLLLRWHTVPITLAAARRRVSWPDWRREGLRSLPQLSASQWMWIVTGVTLLAFFLRMFTAATQELRPDEGFSYLFASLPFSDIIPRLIPAGEPHSPFQIFTLHSMLLLGGNSELSIRLSTILPGVLVIPLVAQWGRIVAGKRAGILTALFMTLSQSQVWLGQDGRNQYTLVLLFGLLATCILVKAVHQQRLKYWVAYSICAAASVHSHYFGVFLLIAHGGNVIFSPLWQSRIRPWVLSGVAVAVLVLPWPLYTWQQMAERHLADELEINLGRHLTRIGVDLTVGQAFDHAWGRWLFLIAGLVASIGWFALWQRRRNWAGLIVVWVFAATWGVFLVRFWRSMFNEYYMSMVAPGFWLLVAVGILTLWRQRWWRGRATAVLTFILLLSGSLTSLIHYYGQQEKYGRFIGYREIVVLLNAQEKSGDLLLLHSPDPAMEYYLERVSIPFTRQPTRFGMKESEINAAVSELAQAYGRIWFVPVDNNLIDPTAAVPRWLNYHLLHEQEVQTGKLTLQAFRPVATVEEVYTPINQKLADWLELEGVYVTVGGRPLPPTNPPVQPGETVAVTLIWTAYQPVPQDFTVFTHMMNGAGQMVAQKDGTPLVGTRPTTTWAAGERLIDRYELSIPAETPPQEVTIWVGLYDPITLERQVFTGGETAISVQTLRITPAGSE